MTVINKHFVAALVYDGLDVDWVRGLAAAPTTSKGKGIPPGAIYKLSFRNVIKRVGTADHGTIWAPGACYVKFLKALQKVHIPCERTHSHGTTGGNGECAPHVLQGGAPKTEEDEGHADLGGVHSQIGGTEERISESSRPPLTKASGAKVVCMDISAADSINRLPDLTEGTL